LDDGEIWFASSAAMTYRDAQADEVPAVVAKRGRVYDRQGFRARLSGGRLQCGFFVAIASAAYSLVELAFIRFGQLALNVFNAIAC
jgi:hypothetical protein